MKTYKKYLSKALQDISSSANSLKNINVKPNYLIWVLFILILCAYIVIYSDKTITLWSRDNFLLNVSIVLTLLFALIWVFQIKKQTTDKILIDYFKIRKLEVTLAFAVLYIMFAFLSVTIIFTYAALYESQKVCHPLMYYLGNKRGCRSDPKINAFTNINPNPIADIQTATSRLYSSLEGFQTVSNYLKTISNSYETLQNQYFDTQEKTIDALTNAVVDPINIHVLPFLFKPIEKYLNTT